jgi:hypothetical protein
MGNRKVPSSGKQIQGHSRNFSGMSIPILYWQATGNLKYLKKTGYITMNKLLWNLKKLSFLHINENMEIKS